MKEKKKKIIWQQWVSMVFFLLVGGLCGILMIRYIEPMMEGKSSNAVFLFFAVAIIELYAAIFLQIIIHEAGHLVFGLLSGYQYSSFRVGSLMWMKVDGKIKLKKFSMAGTGGQCLMVPPEMVEGKVPFVLYNLGGSIMNMAVSTLFMVLSFVCGENFFSMFCIIFAVIGYAFALMNGIPMRMGTVDNDGYNALSLGKKESALRSFWVQMKANDLMTRGVSLKNMPEEWFYLPTDEELNNSMTAVMAVFYCNRLMDEHRFEEAYATMERLLNMETAIVGIHSGLLRCDCVYCELIGENRPEQREKFLDKQQKKLMKAMKTYPSVIRTEYAYALLGEKDKEKAEKILENFEKCAKTYPYASDIASERSFIEKAGKVAAEKEEEVNEKTL